MNTQKQKGVVKVQADAYSGALKQLEKVNKIINLEVNIHEQLKTPHRVIEVAIPVKMDNGQIKVFQGLKGLKLCLSLLKILNGFVSLRLVS